MEKHYKCKTCGQIISNEEYIEYKGQCRHCLAQDIQQMRNNQKKDTNKSIH